MYLQSYLTHVQGQVGLSIHISKLTLTAVWKCTYNFVTIICAVTHYYCFISDLLSVSLVAQELTAVREKWQDIGQELGVEQYSLRYIRSNHSDPGDCLWKALSKRFQCCTTTWKDIVAVLGTPHIGESHLANHLEAKYCSSELINLVQ